MEENYDILYCEKTNYDEQQNLKFWQKLRELIQNQKNKKDVLYIKDNMYKFQNIVFPPFDIFTMMKIENSNSELKEDYLFWEKGQHKDFKNLVQFTNCTFYNFKFNDITVQSLNFTDCIIKGALLFYFNNIDNIIFHKVKEIDKLEINTSNLKMLQLNECMINNLKIKNTKVDLITFTNLNIQSILMDTLSIKEGKFNDLNIQKVEDNTTIFLDDINKFSYNNVNAKNANREYFRFLKKFFNEKDDFINYNEMYEKEMESYFKELKREIKERKNLVINLQNILVVGFAKYTSIFGKSSLRPFILLIVCSFLNVYFTNDYSLNYLFSGCGNLWKQIFQSVYFFDKETLTSLRAIFNIFQGLLIYQLVVSIKRKIKY